MPKEDQMRNTLRVIALASFDSVARECCFDVLEETESEVRSELSQTCWSEDLNRLREALTDNLKNSSHAGAKRRWNAGADPRLIGTREVRDMTSDMEIVEISIPKNCNSISVACPLCRSENRVNATGYRVNNSGVFINELTYGVGCGSCDSDFGLKASVQGPVKTWESSKFMNAIKNILFMLATTGLGFALMAALSLKFEWKWGVESVPFSIHYAAHVDGALIGLIIGFSASLLHMSLRVNPVPKAQ